MSNVERRLRRLELIHGGKDAQIIVVSVAAGTGNSEVEAFLARSGIRATERDLVICVQSRFDADAPDRPVPSLLMVRNR